MIYTTSICNNYLPKAIILAMSIKKCDPTSIFVLCITERQVHEEATKSKYFDQVILSKDLGFENFDKFMDLPFVR